MEKIRLSKRMAELGLCSRREADGYIEKGLVEVDGEIVSELGSKVYPAQQITLRSAAQNTQQQRHVAVVVQRDIDPADAGAEQPEAERKTQTSRRARAVGAPPQDEQHGERQHRDDEDPERRETEDA